MPFDFDPGNFGGVSTRDAVAAHAAARRHTATGAAEQTCGLGSAENLQQVHIMQPSALALALEALQQLSDPGATSCVCCTDSKRSNFRWQTNSPSVRPRPGACLVAAPNVPPYGLPSMAAAASGTQGSCRCYDVVWGPNALFPYYLV